MTVKELVESFKNVVDENGNELEIKDDTEVWMLSDAEGNDCHVLETVGYDFAQAHRLVMVMVPRHGSVGGIDW